MIRLRAVGECLIEVGEERVGPDAEVAFALLLVLVLARGRPVARRQLVDLLWPASSEARARHNLRQTLYKLRQLGVPATTESSQVRLAAAAVCSDVLLDGELEGPAPAELLRPDLPFGEFLAGYAPTFSAPFAAWVEEQRGVMHARLRRAVLALLLDERRRGSWGAVETLARKCLQLDPLNEEATLALAEATALTGSKHAALAILDGYLHEVGEASGDLRLPATVLRRRIAERLQPAPSPVLAESCFVGREESVAFLYEHFRGATEQGGRAVLVWGEAGMGKSRLLTEFGRMAMLEGAQVVRVGCQARDTERPLSVFVDAVPLLLGLPGALGCAPASMGYLKRLTEHDPAVVEPSAVTREAELLFACVRRAIFDLVDAVASEMPLVLCVEDVHWLDEQSWRVLRELIGWLEGRPILIVLSSRLPHATPTPAARQAPGLVMHRLPALDQQASAAVFELATDLAPPPAAFRSWCLQVAEGNPLFLRAAGAHWVETRELRAPPSVERLVHERVQRLAPRPLRVLQACAVLGSMSTFDRLLRVLGLTPPELVRLVTELESEGLLTASPSSIVCRHSLVEQSAISSLSPGAVLVLHHCAASTLEEEVRVDSSVALLWACTHHWHAAGESGRAIKLARTCIAHMLALGLPHIAADTAEVLLKGCTSSDDRLLVLTDLVTGLHRSGRWERLLQVLPEYTEVRRTLLPLADEHTEHELIALEAALLTGGNLNALLRDAEKCVVELNASAAHRVEAAWMALLFGENLLDTEAMERIYLAVQPLLRLASVERRTVLRVEAIYHSSVGDVDAAVSAANEWVRLERIEEDTARLSRALRNATIPYRVAGLVEPAFAAALESYELASRHQLPSSAAHSADLLATLNLSVGDARGARIWLDRAHHWTGRTEERLAGVSLRYLEARLALFQGQSETALATLSPEIGGAIRAQTPRGQVEAYALVVLALVRTNRIGGVRALLEPFMHLYNSARGFFGQDLATAALVVALRGVDQRAKATRLLEEYITTFRRERTPYSPELTALLSGGPAV